MPIPLEPIDSTPSPGALEPKAADLARSLAQLQEQSDWVRITLSSIGDGVISTDAEGRVSFLNSVAESLTGWTQAEAAGRPLPEIFQIVNHHTREPAENPALRALEEGRIVGLANHTVLIARDGTERPLDDSAAPMRDAAGKIVGTVLVFRDVTDRLRAESMQSQMAAIIESSQDVVISKTLDGIIRSWNPEAERVFGHRAAEAIGRSISLIIPPERMDEEREIIERLRRGERVEHFETVRVAKDGRRVNLSLTISPIRDPSGRIVGASKVARDITDRLRAEEALREADRAKDQFLAVLAHELRNPLAPLRHGLQVLRLAGADTRTAAKAQEMMERQLGHLIRLVDDLLDISRISRNKIELQRSPILLAEVLSNAVEMAHPTIEAAGHHLTVALPAEPIHLDADLLRLAQVFNNLLANSVKYTDRGGDIWLTAERQGDTVAVAVRDSGIGIPAGALPHVFDMFAQVDRSLERPIGGLGIGLALVKGLVEMHGGTVTAESPGPGEGSTFTVRLPVMEESRERAAEGGRGEPAATAPPKRRVLVVDDNLDAAGSLAILLELLGNDVQTVHDGVEGVAAAERFRPDLILMDVGMPNLNGYEATRRIREQPWGQEMVIFALTGWGQESDKDRSREAGCDGHLVKPVSMEDLERLLPGLVALPPAGG